MNYNILDRVFSNKEIVETNENNNYAEYSAPIVYNLVNLLGLKFKFKNNQKTNELIIKNLMRETGMLRLLLQRSIDITKVPSATGSLRLIQKIKSKILEMAVKILTKHNIKYWLEYGTLIGAIRHKGFIPWDDDIDVCLFKDDYNKLPYILNELSLYDSDFYISKGVAGSQIIRLVYKNYCIDFFPCEYLDYRRTTSQEKEDLEQKWLLLVNKIRNRYNDLQRYIKDFWTFHYSDEINEMRNELLGYNYVPNSKSGQIIVSPDTFMDDICAILEEDDIFPLQEVEFENYMYLAPKNPIKHLYQTHNYGPMGAVMEFPKLADTGYHHMIRKYNDIERYEEDYKKLLLLEEFLKEKGVL